MKKIVLFILLIPIISAFGQFAPNTLDYKKAKRFIRSMKPNNNTIILKTEPNATGYEGRLTKVGKKFKVIIFITNKLYTVQICFQHDNKKPKLTNEEIQKVLNLVDQGEWIIDPSDDRFFLSPQKIFRANYLNADVYGEYWLTVKRVKQ